MPRSHRSGAGGVARSASPIGRSINKGPARPRFRRTDHPVRSNWGGFAKSYWCRGHPSSARRPAWNGTVCRRCVPVCRRGQRVVLFHWLRFRDQICRRKWDFWRGHLV